MILLHNSLKSFFLYSLLICLTFHFVKDNTNFYYLALIIIYIALFINFIIDNKSYLSNDLAQNVYLFFLLHLLIICVYTLWIYESEFRDNFSLIHVLTSFGRVMLMPILPLLIVGLFSRIDDFNKIFSYFLLIMCLGTLTMAIQQVIGGLSVFGSSGTPRFAGMIPYSGSVGNITIYGTTAAIPIIIATSKRYSAFIKILIIILVSLGCLLTMQKSGLVNLFLSIIAVLFLVSKMTSLKLILTVTILSSLIIYSFPKVGYNAASLYSNTFGYEIIEGTTHKGIYRPIGKSFLERAGGLFLKKPDSIREFLIGNGNFGGSDALGFNLTEETFPDIEKNVPNISTTHNQFLDIYQQGGLLLLINFIFLLLVVQISLAKKWFNESDENAKILFICNCFTIINFTVANGLIYHPIASFIFWISITFIIFNNTNKI